MIGQSPVACGHGTVARAFSLCHACERNQRAALVSLCESDSNADPARWDAASPRDAVAWFANVSVPWWVAGGWAIDLFLDRQTRLHRDLDIGVFRRDIDAVLASIPGYEVFEAKDGKLSYLCRRTPRSEVNSLWCRAPGAQTWQFEIMLDEFRGRSWVYRRDPSIRRDPASMIRTHDTGIPYLAPEVQLLYKARAMRARDMQDFDAVVPELSPAARRWLWQCLLQTLPSHPWIGRLDCSGEAHPGVIHG